MKVCVFDPFNATVFNRSLCEKQIFLLFTICVAGKEARQIGLKLLDLIFDCKFKNTNKSLYEFYSSDKKEVKNPFIEISNYEFDICGFLPNEKNVFKRIYFLIKENILEDRLKQVKMGKYSTIIKAFNYIVDNNIDLNSTNPSYYENIPGISFKSSRFYILHTFENTNIACLDTHILKSLNLCKYDSVDGIKSTPNSKKKYLEIEKDFLDLHSKFVNRKLPTEILKFFDDLLTEYKNTNNLESVSGFDLALWNAYKDVHNNRHPLIKK